VASPVLLSKASIDERAKEAWAKREPHSLAEYWVLATCVIYSKTWLRLKAYTCEKLVSKELYS